MSSDHSKGRIGRGGHFHAGRNAPDVLRDGARYDLQGRAQRRAGQIDLIFPQFVLSGGKYLISAALAITGAEWLVRSQEIVFEVEPRDIFQSGFPPRVPRSTVAQDHRWEIVK